jgi:hypothetical protein
MTNGATCNQDERSGRVNDLGIVQAGRGGEWVWRERSGNSLEKTLEKMRLFPVSRESLNLQ